jgi:peroxidase
MNVNPGIANEFSTAAFRIGHTIINDDVEFLDNDGNALHEEVDLADVFFEPSLIKEQGADPILKYLATDNTQEVDTKLDR